MKDEESYSHIKVRGGYSDMTGINPYHADIQINEFDDRTRVILSNKLFGILEYIFETGLFDYKYSSSYGIVSDGGNEFCKAILSDVFAERTDLNRGYIFDWRRVYDNNIYETIASEPYNEVLDIIWFVCHWLYNNMLPETDYYFDIFNNVFERENVGYRFIGRQIVAITDENEVAEITKACNCKFEGCVSHMKKAAAFLTNRERKDYKNSIKESISAIESVCQIITEDCKASLGQALKVLKDNGFNLHPALEKSFSSLYGYTCDKGGIRHCEGLFESDVSFEEAKFMLVSCSAFLNYLIAESEKHGI